jgi:transposase-like protein
MFLKISSDLEAARSAYVRFERVWAKRCPGVVASLREGGDELLTFFTFPKAQWKRSGPSTRSNDFTRSFDGG